MLVIDARVLDVLKNYGMCDLSCVCVCDALRKEKLGYVEDGGPQQGKPVLG